MASAEQNIKYLAKKVEGARARLTRLQADTMRAEGELSSARDRRRNLLLDGDSNDQNSRSLRAADEAIARCTRALDGFADAIMVAQQQHKDAEREVAAAHDQRRRQVEADRTKATIAIVEKAHADFTAAAKPLIIALRGIEQFEADALANGLASVLLALGDHSIAGIPVLLKGLRDYAAAVVAGDAEISRSKTEVKPAAQPKVESTTIFLTESLLWRDSAGVIHAVRQYSTASLPPPLAAKAVKCGGALQIGDPRIDKLRAAFATSGFEIAAAPSDCVDLDRLDPGIDLQHIAAATIIEKQRQATAA